MPPGDWQHVHIPALLLLAAALALADASVVTLALPPIIDELDASVEGAAAVLGCYTLVLAIALPLVARLRTGPRVVGAAGGALFAAASLGCGLSGSLPPLLLWRCLQAAGAAAVLVAAFSLLDAGRSGRRAWNAAAIFGFAAGPALGGALTQALDWRAIFLVQAPIAAAAAVAAWRSREPFIPPEEPAPWAVGPAVALAMVSAALVGVLFLLVLLLITGWSVSPLAAAAAVSVLPIAAVVAARWAGGQQPRVRAAAGAALVGGGVLALGSIPSASLWWTIVPQLMAGAGMGLALPALAGELLPERTAGQAARLLSLATSASPSRSRCSRRSPRRGSTTPSPPAASRARRWCSTRSCRRSTSSSSPRRWSAISIRSTRAGSCRRRWRRRAAASATTIGRRTRRSRAAPTRRSSRACARRSRRRS